jgi:hypothetical protein
VFIGLFRLPYGYYIVLRTIICIAAAYGFSAAWQIRSDKGRWVYGVVAVVYNPIFPARLGSKELWIAINVVTVVVFWTQFVLARRNRAKHQGSPR